MLAAFGQAASHIAPGEALIFHPDAKGNIERIARVRIEEWPRLAAAQR